MWQRIGAAIARELKRQQVHLALTYHSSRQSIEELIKELESVDETSTEHANSCKVSIHQADMAKLCDLRRLFDEVNSEHGRYPDILVANAGHGKPIPYLEDIAIEEWDHTIAVNLTATFVLCKLAVPHMKTQNWGRIIFMGSISGYGGGINGCHYAASKGGLMAMVKNLATKLGPYGITINDIAPAMIGDTGLIPVAKTVEGTPGDVRNIPVGRLGRPEEVANVVTLMCRTGYLTGQSILLSGGLK
jgi:3-oxoacyl-[acyl-carrier protein] reductase